MTKNSVIIQDNALVAYSTRRNPNPAGEAYVHAIFCDRTMRRLKESIIKIMDETQKTHADNKPKSNGNYITRATTNECFFYTQKPLTLREFETLQNQLAEKAKTMSPGVHLILGSFAVITNNKVMSVTPHIACGPNPKFCFIVKNNVSSIDVRYRIADVDGGETTLPVIDRKNTEPSSLPKIKVNERTEEFTFNTLVHCKTPNGTPFLTSIDVCFDHSKGVAKADYSNYIQYNPNAIKQPVSHVVVSNSIRLSKECSIEPKIMHVDPFYSSKTRCKEGVGQKEGFSQSMSFRTRFRTIRVAPEAVSTFINVNNNYEYKTISPSDGRWHFYSATLDNVQFIKTPSQAEFLALKKNYQQFKGDSLKNKILENLKTKIEDTKSLIELEALKQEIEGSLEHEILKTGQGVFTQLFKIKTSSQTALESMFEQQEKSLSALKNKFNI